MTDGFVSLSYDVQWFAMGVIAVATIVPAIVNHIATLRLLRHCGLDVVAARDPASEAPRAEHHPPRITILIPAFNERQTVVQVVKAACASDYPGELEVIAINDGSHDDTLEVLMRAFQLHAIECHPSAQCPCNEPTKLYGTLIGARELRVVDKRNGGKSDALNAGINIARGAYICVIDADTLLAPDAISGMWCAIRSSPEIVAVAGCVAIGSCAGADVPLNDDRSPLLVSLQRLEYVREFAISRALKTRLGRLVGIPGAFGLFPRDLLIEIGGYTRDTVGEDLEITVRIHRHLLDRRKPYEIRFANRALAWTEAPETLGRLACQRGRWARAALQTLGRHHDMVFARRYGLIGLWGIGSILIHNILAPTLGMAIPVAFLVADLTDIARWTSVLAFWLLSSSLAFTTEIHAFGTLRRVLPNHPGCAVGSGRSVIILLVYAFAYQYLLLLFRAYGVWQQITRPQHWGEIPRRSLTT